MLFSNSAHQISRMKSVPWHSKNRSAFFKTWFGSGKWLFYFFKVAFFRLSECCVYPTSELFTLLRFYYLLLLSAVLALQPWRECLAGVWFVHHRQDCNFTLKSLAMMQELGKSTTQLLHPRLSLQCCQLKKIWTWASFFFFPHRKSHQNLELEKKLIWKLARRQ